MDRKFKPCLDYPCKNYLQMKNYFPVIGVLLTDLWKAFDCLPHELSIARLDVYSFEKSSLKSTHSYLSNRKQRVKINDRYSLRSEILFRVPQGSILGSLLFNISICDLFSFLEGFDIENYADDSTPYCPGKSAELVLTILYMKDL